MARGASSGEGGININNRSRYQGMIAPRPAPVAASPAAQPVPQQVGQVTNLTNTAQPDPDMSSFMSQMRGRIAQAQSRETPDPNLQTQVNRVGERLSTDTTQRAQDFAAQDIGARARAAAKAAQESSVRRGMASGTGVEAAEVQRVRDNAQREAARSAAGIALGREAQLDNLVLGSQNIMAAPGQHMLQRESMTNSLIGEGFNQAQGIAGQNLADRNFGLNQWQAGANYNLAAGDQSMRANDNLLTRQLAFARMGGW